MEKLYGLIADFIVIFHGLIIIYLTLGTISVLIKKKTPKWWNISMFIMMPIAFISYGTINDCPINVVERYFRQLAGQGYYQEGFLSHYVFDSLGITLRTGTVELLMGIFFGITLLFYFKNKIFKNNLKCETK